MSDDTKPKPTKPASRIDIIVGGETKTVFMSFGLLNELTPLVGGPEKIAEFDFDAHLREFTALLCLGERDERRKLKQDYQLPQDFEMEQAELLIDWVKEHVLDFFIRRLMKNIEAFDKNAEMLKMSAQVLPPQTALSQGSLKN